MIKYWKRGRADSKQFRRLKFQRKLDWGAFFLSILLTVVIVAPVAAAFALTFALFSYSHIAVAVLLVIAWLLLLGCNGISNYLNVRLVKLYYPEDVLLAEIDEKAVGFYHFASLGFAIFTLGLVIVGIIIW